MNAPELSYMFRAIIYIVFKEPQQKHKLKVTTLENTVKLIDNLYTFYM